MDNEIVNLSQILNNKTKYKKTRFLILPKKFKSITIKKLKKNEYSIDISYKEL